MSSKNAHSGHRRKHDGDFTVLQDRLDRAKQNAASMQVIVDAYDKDKVK